MTISISIPEWAVYAIVTFLITWFILDKISINRQIKKMLKKEAEKIGKA